jgi:outer membrane protein OmpA-like peptidoglycan-associated protein
MKRAWYFAVVLLVLAGCTARPIGGPGGWKVVGPAGPEGPMGPMGPAGQAGAPGIAGVQGPTGPQGAMGATGAQGVAGVAGADFKWATFADIAFEKGKAEILPTEAEKISVLATYLKAHPMVKAELEAFADPRGGEKYNLALTQKRAAAVQGWMVKLGVPAEQITAMGYGELNQKCKQAAEGCWSKDRRVEVVLIPMGTSDGIGGASPASK